MSVEFDIIPFSDIGPASKWTRIGGGSFGSVYKGMYLGTDVAIKEVKPSTEYDVAKYFEREWIIQREARHPNIALFLGRSFDPVTSITYIISEFVPNGNLRSFLLSPVHLPWRTRLSLLLDISRALAYLHARDCMHRDLKGENLLVGHGNRVKVCDFGFSRVLGGAGKGGEGGYLTYCGTDGYMSPEILLGLEFDLSTDVFSLGIIFCEVLSRKLVDSHAFKRNPPSFTIDPVEVRQRASPGCPPDLIALALECTSETPSSRPTMPIVIERLLAIEADVLAKEGDGPARRPTEHRPGAPPRIPSFGMGSRFGVPLPEKSVSELEAHTEEAELAEAMRGLESARIEDGAEGRSSWRTARWGGESVGLGNSNIANLLDERPLLAPSTVASESGAPSAISIDTASTMTVKPLTNAEEDGQAHAPPDTAPATASVQTFVTAHTHTPSIAAATVGGDSAILANEDEGGKETLKGAPAAVAADKHKSPARTTSPFGRGKWGGLFGGRK